MIFDPKAMAETVALFSHALRTLPAQRFDEPGEEFAARYRAWLRKHEQAVKDADNPAWVDEIQNLLRESKTYSKGPCH